VNRAEHLGFWLGGKLRPEISLRYFVSAGAVGGGPAYGLRQFV